MNTKSLSFLIVTLLASQFCPGICTDTANKTLASAPASAAPKSTSVETAKTLHKFYPSGSLSREESLRRQQWWSKEYMRRQNVLRMDIWQRSREQADFQKQMANPRSAAAIRYKQVYAETHKNLSNHKSEPNNKEKSKSSL